MLRYPTTVRTLRNLMENQSQTAAQQKVHFHYNHTDSCKFSRWTARECYEFMYARPWHNVVDFYADMVKGHTSLSGLFGKETPADHEDAEIREDHEKSELVSFPVKDKSKDKSGRWAKANFKIVLSYHGGSFDGWQKQPDLNIIQGLDERSLGEFVDEKKAQLLKDKNLPLEGCALVAGRTDKGVSASQQVQLPEEVTPSAHITQTEFAGRKNHNTGSGSTPNKKSRSIPKRKGKSSSRKQVKDGNFAKMFASKEAREEVTKYEGIKNEATSKLNSVYEEIRPIIQEHGLDNQDRVPTSVAEKWIDAHCSKYTADFDLYFSVIKNAMCPRPATDTTAGAGPSEGGTVPQTANAEAKPSEGRSE